MKEKSWKGRIRTDTSLRKLSRSKPGLLKLSELKAGRSQRRPQTKVSVERRLILSKSMRKQRWVGRGSEGEGEEEEEEEEDDDEGDGG